MPLTHADFMKLANGSDIRGVAVAGVEGEPVTLTPEAANRIAAGFVRLLTEKTGKKPEELQIAVGHDSRISALAIKDCVLTGLTHTGAHGIDCVLASTPAMFMATIFEDTAADGSIMILQPQRAEILHRCRRRGQGGHQEDPHLCRRSRGGARHPRQRAEI